MTAAPPGRRVLVVTPCHDDGWALDGLARSVRDQREAPVRWVVVDDASTDDTPRVLERLGREVDVLRVLRRQRPPGRRIGEKARAVAAGVTSADVDHDLVAVVDADVVLPPDYLAVVADAFAADPVLGVTGGVYLEGDDTDAAPVPGRAAGAHVPGPAQVFRREVFEAIGGYAPLPHGGDDVESVVRARMLGWRTGVVPGLRYRHRRRMGTGGRRSRMRADLELGRQDHDLGTWPPFEVLKLARHVTRRPRGLAAAARATGYVEAALRRRPRPVDDEFVDFVRGEQRRRLTSAGRRLAPTAAAGAGSAPSGTGPAASPSPPGGATRP